MADINVCMKDAKSTMKKFCISFIALLVISLLIILLYYNWGKMAFPVILDKFVTKNVPDPSIVFVANIESKILRLKIRVVCNKQAQRDAIIKKKPRIKHVMVNLIKEEEMKRYVLNREFGELRKAILRIINKEIAEPVKTIHIEQFFFD